MCSVATVLGEDQDIENGDDKDSATPSPAVGHWTVVLTCVAIVATAYLIVGLLHEREPELTTAPPPPTASEPPPEPPEYSYVTPPVTFPTRIPGCDVVEPPQPGQGFAMMTVGTYLPVTGHSSSSAPILPKT